MVLYFKQAAGGIPCEMTFISDEPVNIALPQVLTLSV